jgi:hypothetical protein
MRLTVEPSPFVAFGVKRIAAIQRFFFVKPSPEEEAVRSTSVARWIAAVAAAATVAVLGIVQPASAAEPHQLSSIALPFGSYQDMAVDAGHGHLFLSGDNVVVVTDLDGTVVKTIKRMQGASGLALSADGTTLYVGLNGANAIAAIDTAKLKEKVRYSVGVLCPRDLALAQGRIWFSHECDLDRAGFSSLQPGGQDPVVRQWAVTPLFRPRLVATQQFPDVLLVSMPFQSEPLALYDISGGDPVELATAFEAPARVRDLALAAGGTQVVLAAGNDGHPRLLSFGFTPLGVYPSGPQPNAVAVGAQDRVAAGVEDVTVGALDLFVYEAEATSPTWTWDFGVRANSQLADKLAEHGLAWGPDNSRLYAVTVLFDGTAPVLHVLSDTP